MSSSMRGVFSVMVTPFNSDGAIDEPALRKYVNWQIEEGIHGLIPLGSTGEFLSLTDLERHDVARIVIEESNGRVPVIIGTGAESSVDVVRYSLEAENLGAEGVMIIPPYYSSPTEDELFEHYRAIGEAISIPIMIYNNPATANVDIVPSMVHRLAQLDAVQYIKESTMDITRVRDITELCGDQITVFGGIMGFESFIEGAEGWVSVGSNIMPRKSANLFDLIDKKQDLLAARSTNRELVPVIRLVSGHRYVSATKTALELMGISVGPPRPPRLPSPTEERQLVSDCLESIGLLNSING